MGLELYKLTNKLSFLNILFNWSEDVRGILVVESKKQAVIKFPTFCRQLHLSK